MSAQARWNIEAAEILLAARDDISREGGWRQYSAGPVAEPDGAVCALGAIARQEKVYGHTSPACRVARMALYKQIDSAEFNNLIVEWNDEKGRTVEEVMAAMDAAAADLKGRDTPTPPGCLTRPSRSLNWTYKSHARK